MEEQNISDARLEANRTNAGKSTGPRTDAGKQASSRNATRHALAGHQFTLRYDESEEEYRQLLSDLLSQHRSADTTEEILVVRMAQSYWLTQRAIRIATADENDRHQLILMMRYQALHERSFQSALKQLVQLRQTRESQAREDHLVASSTKLVELDLKLVRLDLLKAKRNLAEQQLAENARIAAINDYINGPMPVPDHDQAA